MQIAHLNRQRQQTFATWARELLDDSTIPDERVFPALRQIVVCRDNVSKLDQKFIGVITLMTSIVFRLHFRVPLLLSCRLTIR